MNLFRSFAGAIALSTGVLTGAGNPVLAADAPSPTTPSSPEAAAASTPPPLPRVSTTPLPFPSETTEPPSLEAPDTAADFFDAADAFRSYWLSHGGENGHYGRPVSPLLSFSGLQVQHCERGLLVLLPQSGTPRDTRIDFMGIASFLAATDSGVLSAAPASSDTPNVLTRVVDLPSARSQEQGRAPSLLFEVSDGWVVRGLAASGSHRLCVISSEDPTDISSYIGLWDEASSSSHVPPVGFTFCPLLPLWRFRGTPWRGVRVRSRTTRRCTSCAGQILSHSSRARHPDTRALPCPLREQRWRFPGFRRLQRPPG